MTEKTIQATETSFGIIEYLREVDGASLSDIATEMEYAVSTIHNHLTTLENLGFVVREDGTYHLGLEFLRHGWHVHHRKAVNQMATKYTETLAAETDEQAHFIVEENGRGYHVQISSGTRATSIDSHPGKRIYLHANAAGKAILAYYPQWRVDEILDRWGLPAVTEHTITDREAFLEELGDVRERGYAHNREEHVTGYCGIAAPVRPGTGDVLGALAVGGPVSRFTGDFVNEELPGHLLDVVNEFELEIEFA